MFVVFHGITIIGIICLLVYRVHLSPGIQQCKYLNCNNLVFLDSLTSYVLFFLMELV